MNEETTLKLIEAMNRLAAVLDRVTGGGSLMGGIQVYHHGIPSYPNPYYQPPQSPYAPYTTTCGTGGANG